MFSVIVSTSRQSIRKVKERCGNINRALSFGGYGSKVTSNSVSARLLMQAAPPWNYRIWSKSFLIHEWFLVFFWNELRQLPEYGYSWIKFRGTILFFTASLERTFFGKNYIGSRVLSVRLKKVCNFQFCSIIKMDEKTVLYWKSFIRQGFDKLIAILMNFSPTAVKSLQRRFVEALDFNKTSLFSSSRGVPLHFSVRWFRWSLILLKA